MHQVAKHQPASSSWVSVLLSAGFSDCWCLWITSRADSCLEISLPWPWLPQLFHAYYFSSTGGDVIAFCFNSLSLSCTQQEPCTIHSPTRDHYSQPHGLHLTQSEMLNKPLKTPPYCLYPTLLLQRPRTFHLYVNHPLLLRRKTS